MDYEQIKADVQEFKKIAAFVGLIGYCGIGSLLLTCCLADHHIQSELVKGYIIADNKYWILHIWNKIYINNKTHQINITYSPSKEMGIDLKQQYTLTLCDKWETLIDTKEEQNDYDQVSEFYRLYKEQRIESALAYFSKHRKHVKQFEIIFDYVSKLKTFSSIQKYRYILE